MMFQYELQPLLGLKVESAIGASCSGQLYEFQEVLFTLYA